MERERGQADFSPPRSGGDGMSAARSRGGRPRIRSTNRSLHASQVVPPLPLVPRGVSPKGREKGVGRFFSPAERGRRHERSEGQRGPTAKSCFQPLAANRPAKSLLVGTTVTTVSFRPSGSCNRNGCPNGTDLHGRFAAVETIRLFEANPPATRVRRVRTKDRAAKDSCEFSGNRSDGG